MEIDSTKTFETQIFAAWSNFANVCTYVKDRCSPGSRTEWNLHKYYRLKGSECPRRSWDSKDVHSVTDTLDGHYNAEAAMVKSHRNECNLFQRNFINNNKTSREFAHRPSSPYFYSRSSLLSGVKNVLHACVWRVMFKSSFITTDLASSCLDGRLHL